ncbi:MAG: transcription elongation factor [Desulfurococcales archaeon]|nr:transcription elongation factor [Desulfurococcales archaeon]
MKFCPKCGSVMVVVRKEGKLYYQCTRCGYMEPVKKGESMKIVERADKKKKVVSTKSVAENTAIMRSREEIQQEIEEYYEQVLDQLADEY